MKRRDLCKKIIPLLLVNELEKIMHNLLSFNQLDEWRHIEKLDHIKSEIDLINDYYECLIECADDQSTCKRICRGILSE